MQMSGDGKGKYVVFRDESRQGKAPWAQQKVRPRSEGFFLRRGICLWFLGWGGGGEGAAGVYSLGSGGMRTVPESA